MNDIFQHYAQTGQKEMITKNEDGSYSVFIDPRLNYESQFREMIHAVKHINRNDFRHGITADQAERQAH